MLPEIMVTQLSSVCGHFTINNGLRLSSLLLLFPQRLRGFEFVHLWKTQQQQRVSLQSSCGRWGS